MMVYNIVKIVKGAVFWMSREEILMGLIKSKYRSLRNFSIESGIANSTLNSMLTKGIGGTSVDTVMRVCSLLGCDLYSLSDNSDNATSDDRAFFSDYLKLSESSKELVRIVAAHQLSNETKELSKETKVAAFNVVSFPVEKTLSMRTMRVYTNSASAGFGEYLEDSDYEDIEVSPDVPSNADFGITIHGDSMMPKINDGDVVWVREQETLEPNEIGVFVLNGDALCKKLVSVSGRFFLRSLNDKYRDIPIGEDDTLKVIGKVLHSTPFPAY